MFPSSHLLDLYQPIVMWSLVQLQQAWKWSGSKTAQQSSQAAAAALACLSMTERDMWVRNYQLFFSKNVQNWRVWRPEEFR